MRLLAGKRVLLWGSHPRALGALECSLENQGARTEKVGSLEQALAVLRGEDVDLMVAQLCEGFAHPLELLTCLGEEPSAPPVLMVAGAMDVSLYLEAMRRGAFDCIGLPLNEMELLRIVSRALEAQGARVTSGGGSR
jgi:DNA-binding NtrC family response regulator